MTNLSDKFDTFETLTTTHHDAIIAALTALAGHLPSEPDPNTLADVITAIEAGNTDLSVIRTNVILLHALIEDHIPSLHTAINQLATNSEIIIQNMAVNAQYAHSDASAAIARLEGLDTHLSYNLQLINSTLLSTACPCTDAPPLLEPPLSGTPLEYSDEEKCARIQAFLAMFGSLVDGISTLGGAGAGVTTAALGVLLTEAATAGGLLGGEVGAVAGPPGIIAGVIIGAIAAALSALGAAAMQTLSTQWHTEPLIAQLRDNLFDVDDAASGHLRFQAVVSASGVLTTPWRQIISALWWHSWSNDLYNAGVTIDTTGFDGTICTTPGEHDPGCGAWPNTVMTWGSDEMLTISSPYGPRIIPNWSKYGIRTIDDGRPGELSAVLAPCAAWTYTASGTTLQFYQSAPDPELNSFVPLDAPAGSIAVATSKLVFWSYDLPWTLTLTPP